MANLASLTVPRDSFVGRSLAARVAQELQPKFSEAAWSLSNLKTYRFGDAEVASMVTILASDQLSDKSVVQFNYALGKAYEHRKQWDDAFACYAAGNLRQKKLVGLLKA